MVNKEKITAVIQARMGSSRFPGKVLKKIQGKPILWHIINRLERVKLLDGIVIATSDLSQDDKIYKMAKKYKFDIFRGSENDVLERFFGAAKKKNAKFVLRVTGDCPLIDPIVIDDLINKFFDKRFDFCGVACGAGVSNSMNINRFPDGLDAEIFSFKVLEDAHLNAKSDLQREHVTPYIWQNNKRYKIGTLHSENDYSNLRLTVDNKEDFEFISWIYKILFPKDPNFNLNTIVELLRENPKKIKNKHLVGNEGYDEFWI
tara:strand:+ start:128 stop:907 length:780 start_codon:yes stop_codon:yes gene_type:complete